MHEHVEIPWSQLLIPQFFNFALFLVALIYILRKPLKEHFSGRLAQFESHRKKAEQTKAEAERKHYDVEVQLRQLDQNAQKSVTEAEAEAEVLRTKIVREAHDAAKRAGEDVEALAAFEFQRALATLRTQIVNTSVIEAEGSLMKKMDTPIKSRLNDEFTRKLQAAK